MILSTFVAGNPHSVKCLVLSVDLQDSTPFYDQKDAEASILAYLNHLIVDLNTMLRGGYPGELQAKSKKKEDPMPAPLAVKFMGDGFLFIWKQSAVKKKALMKFIANLQTYQNEFKAANNRAMMGDVNRAKLPKALRCGMAGGGLRRLKVKGHQSTEEWIGPAINFACRLQAYSNELKFLLHDVGVLTNAELERIGWMKVKAKKIKGTDGPLLVYGDHMRFSHMGTRTAELFEKIAKDGR